MHLLFIIINLYFCSFGLLLERGVVSFVHKKIVTRNNCFPLQPMSMVLPGVVGFKLSGKLRSGVTATDLVLTVTQILRKHGVVGKFVEFYGKY